MPIEITARAKVQTDEDGRFYLHIDNQPWYQGELSRFETDTPVQITIKKWYKKRSLKQNNLFHAYIAILADFFGYAPDTMKSLIALKWLKEPLYAKNGNELVDITTGEVMFELRSSASLNTFEMMTLCEQIREWAYDGWNVVLPEPSDNLELNFKTINK